MSQFINLGWNAFFEQQVSYKNRTALRGRVCLQGQNHVHVLLENGKTYLATLKVHSRSFPVAGDWVLMEFDPASDRQIIVETLEPNNVIARVRPGSAQEAQLLATNIDVFFVVTSLNDDLNERRLDRYITLGWETGAQPVLILTKADLNESAQQIQVQMENRYPGVPTLILSTLAGVGITEVKDCLGAGRTGIFVGSSGVGKSTLVNALLSEQRLKTAAIREEDSTGRHTTTARHLVALPNDGGIVIDSPGIRELQLLDAEDGLSKTFSDIEELFLHCRFRDCRHQTEPGCAVQQALQKGVLEKDRYQNYQKILREQAYLLRRNNKGAQSIERNKWKQIHRDMRKKKKLNF